MDGQTFDGNRSALPEKICGMIRRELEKTKRQQEQIVTSSTSTSPRLLVSSANGCITVASTMEGESSTSRTRPQKRGKLHLPDLIHDNNLLPRHRFAQRREGNPLKNSNINAVLSHAHRRGRIHVRQNPRIPINRRNRKTFANSAFADLFRS